jgi:hypothetical protein
LKGGEFDGDDSGQKSLSAPEIIDFSTAQWKKKKNENLNRRKPFSIENTLKYTAGYLQHLINSNFAIHRRLRT